MKLKISKYISVNVLNIYGPIMLSTLNFDINCVKTEIENDTFKILFVPCDDKFSD